MMKSVQQLAWGTAAAVGLFLALSGSVAHGSSQDDELAQLLELIQAESASELARYQADEFRASPTFFERLPIIGGIPKRIGDLFGRLRPGSGNLPAPVDSAIRVLLRAEELAVRFFRVDTMLPFRKALETMVNTSPGRFVLKGVLRSQHFSILLRTWIQALTVPSDESNPLRPRLGVEVMKSIQILLQSIEQMQKSRELDSATAITRTKQLLDIIAGRGLLFEDEAVARLAGQILVERKWSPIRQAQEACEHILKEKR